MYPRFRGDDTRLKSGGFTSNTPGRLLQIADHFGRAQQLVDMRSLLSHMVAAEHEIGDIFQLYTPRKLPAQKSLVPVERAGQIVRVLAGKCARIDGCVPQIWAHTHFGYGDDLAHKIVVHDIFGAENLRKCMAQQFACAKLPL